MKKLIVAALVLCFAGTVFADGYPKWYSKRPLVKEAKHGQAGLIFSLPMIKDVIDFGDMGDLFLSALYSPAEKMEVGLQLPLALMSPEGMDRDMISSLGPIWFMYQFHDLLAAYLHLTIPVSDFDAKMIAFRAGVKAKYFVNKQLSIVGQVTFNSNFDFGYIFWLNIIFCDEAKNRLDGRMCCPTSWIRLNSKTVGKRYLPYFSEVFSYLSPFRFLSAGEHLAESILSLHDIFSTGKT